MIKEVVIFCLSIVSFFVITTNLLAQEVPILDYSLNQDGQAELEVNSSSGNYYILKVRHNLNEEFLLATSMTMGRDGRTIITEPLSAYPQSHYQVLEYPIVDPADIDGDGKDDIVEYNTMPVDGPLNAGDPISMDDGVLLFNEFSKFTELAVTKNVVQWSEFLNGKAHVKFLIVDFYTSSPKIYFINSAKHDLHADFARTIGVDPIGDNVKKGQVIFHPQTLSSNGSLGTFTFNYSNGRGQDFDVVQRCHELLAMNIPFINNNLSYYVTANNEEQYAQEIMLYDNSRVSVLFEEDIFAGIDYWGLNQEEGYGFFRQLSLNETPGPKDIVLYESLPNTLPRVSGIMTTVIQTPLSHVNLRAIQNKIPNAFIRDPLAIDSIAELLDKYIYFKVEQDNYIIREATLEEVNDWFEDLRPKDTHVPLLNLDYTTILPLDDIDFSMYDGFGAKCSNVATMRSFGFPLETIPDGYGVPFFYYKEFMNHNQFYDDLDSMITDPEFVADRTVREKMLKDFRKKIKNGDLPQWMLDELEEMHRSFPQGTSVRCRSSTNNEDLIGFSGAGLYTSKTQHPDEGHISKSIKQVYASLWNLRAFEERDFFRVDHYVTCMGVLCHPNYSYEKANGVGVSIDPLYGVENAFYLNTQIGEDLITNPTGTSVPEELLLYKEATSEDDYVVVQYSSLTSDNTIIMNNIHREEMREYMNVIHDEFEMLYNAQGNNTFAMDIEYKITSDNRLIIKQARPWTSYASQPDSIDQGTLIDEGLLIYPNPVSDDLYVRSDRSGLNTIIIYNALGNVIHRQNVSASNIDSHIIDVSTFAQGVYALSFSGDDGATVSKLFIKK